MCLRRTKACSRPASQTTHSSSWGQSCHCERALFGVDWSFDVQCPYGAWSRCVDHSYDAFDRPNDGKPTQVVPGEDHVHKGPAELLMTSGRSVQLWLCVSLVHEKSSWSLFSLLLGSASCSGNDKDQAVSRSRDPWWTSEPQGCLLVGTLRDRPST